MKKTFVSLVTAFALMSSAKASGIPVVDAAAISQSVMQYVQMIKDYQQQITAYKQMLLDTANFEKQMKELGVDMKDINQILGESMSLVNSIQSTYSSITDLPQDFLKNLNKLQSACNFLENKSVNFSQAVNEAKSLNDKVNRCISVASDMESLNKTLNELEATAQKAASIEEYAKAKIEIENIRQAQKYLTQKANEDRKNRLLAFYDTYQSDNSSSPYSKTKMNNDLKTLSAQLKKANNSKQAQALSNSILLKILETSQRQYELNVEYLNAYANNTQASANLSEKLSEEDYQTKYEVVEYEPEVKPMPKDEMGLPKFTF